MSKPIKFKKREIDTTKTKEQREYETTREMADFYRQNPHRFISTELECTTLTWFQDLIVYLACKSARFFYIATRGIGKSYLIAWILITLAILFPRIKIVVASSTKSQARMLVTQKILGEIYNKYPNVRKEINLRKSSDSFNDTYVTFYNKSQIVCVTSTDNARGMRCSILVDDESAKMDDNIKDNVLSKFLQNGDRIPRYKNNPKYAAYKPADEVKKIFHLTSGDFQTNKLYLQCLDAFKHMLGNKDMKQILLSMHWGFPVCEPYISMTYEDDIKPEMESSTFIKLFWEQENEGLFSSESQFSMFSYQGMKKIRTVKDILISIPHYLFTAKNSEKELKAWKKKYYIPKKENEIRVLSIDVAIVGGDRDNTVFTLLSGRPNGKQFEIQTLFMEHASGAHSEVQSIRMKQLYYDFDVDVICLDCQGNGVSISESASKEQYDTQRDVAYPAFTVFNRENMKDRMYNVKDVDSVVNCIFSVKADSKYNHNMLTSLKSSIEKEILSLPLESGAATDYYEDKIQTGKMEATMLNEYLKVNTEIDFFVKEAIALEVKQQQNSPYLKVENPTMRKDRFSSEGIGVYWFKMYEDEIDTDEDGGDLSVEDMYFVI